MLTKRQMEIVKFMSDFLARNDEMPTLRAMSQSFGWRSENAASDHIRALARKGVLERNEIGNWRFTREKA